MYSPRRDSYLLPAAEPAVIVSLFSYASHQATKRIVFVQEHVQLSVATALCSTHDRATRPPSLRKEIPMHSQKTEVEILHSAYHQLWQQMRLNRLFKRFERSKSLLAKSVKTYPKHIAPSL